NENNIEVKTFREGDLYVAELDITNANGKDVGFYFCNETNNPENVASLYLYVDDDDVLFPDENQQMLVVNGKQFQSVVIPCKPTHPSVDVKLYSGVGHDDSNLVR
ncbi:hypothetical protein Trydic_g14434, partial [Trypoxylus dichotomus]